MDKAQRILFESMEEVEATRLFKRGDSSVRLVPWPKYF